MKIFYRISIIVLLVFIFFITYLSLVGFETKKFNNQITQKIKDIDPSLDLELKKIKIILNPLELTFDVKTIGPKLKVKDKILGIENIKTQIQLTSLLKKDLKVESLNISTKSVRPQLYSSYAGSVAYYGADRWRHYNDVGVGSQWALRRIV